MEEWTEPENVERAEWVWKSKGRYVWAQTEKVFLGQRDCVLSDPFTFSPAMSERAGA